MEAINLDLLPGAMPPIVHVSQGDVGRQFKIAIYDDTGAAYSLTGKTLSIVGHKGDGNVFQYAIPSSAISGNEVTITTEEQMTPAAGKALCEIRIEQNGTKLGTCNFVMDVEQGPADMGSLSISALYLIDALFERAQEDIDVATEAAATATQKASEASSSATAAAGSATTAATEAGNAADSATAAANSATAAYNSANDAENAKSGCVIARNDCWAAEERADHYADAATNSATAAANSATAASGYADAADTSADNAADYATAASGSATAAATSANNASASETAAEIAETNAVASATAAAGSASDAAISESNASTSETNAANSATAASGSATNAANSATAAANSATAAAASESKIANMTVSSQSVAYTQPAEVTKTEVSGVYNLDFKIPRGEPTSGHDVEANPSGTATGGDLTKLGIDGTIYNLAGGGGNYKLESCNLPVLHYEYQEGHQVVTSNMDHITIFCDSVVTYSEQDILNYTIPDVVASSSQNIVQIDCVFKANAWNSNGTKFIDNGVVKYPWAFTTFPLKLSMFKDQNGNPIIPDSLYINFYDNSAAGGDVGINITAVDFTTGIWEVSEGAMSNLTSVFGGIMLVETT